MPDRPLTNPVKTPIISVSLSAGRRRKFVGLFLFLAIVSAVAAPAFCADGSYSTVTTGEVVREYWHWLITVAVMMTAMAGVMSYVLKLNRRLNQTQSKLQNELAERKKAEEALKTERDKLQALVSGLGDTGVGIDIIGTDYRVLFQNGILTERFGDVAGKLCYEEYMGRDEPCDSCPMLKAIASGANESIELTAGDGRQYEILVAPLTNADGTVDRVIEVVHDISERKQAEENLKETLAEQERINRLMTGREMRVMELKKQVNELLEKQGMESRYQTTA